MTPQLWDRGGSHWEAPGGRGAAEVLGKGLCWLLLLGLSGLVMLSLAWEGEGPGGSLP